MQGPGCPVLSQLAPSGFATGSRLPAEISDLEFVDAKHRPLLIPEQRQLAGPLQSLGGEGDRLGAVEDRLDQVRSQEGELQRARDVADIGAGAPGDGAEAQALVGIEVVGDPGARLDQPPHEQRVRLRRRCGRALEHDAQFRSASPQPQRRDHQERREVEEGRDDGRRVRRLLQPLEARRRAQLGPGELDPDNQQPERLQADGRRRCAQPVRQLRDAADEPGRCLRSGLAELENVAQEARLAQPRRHGAADRGLDLARGYPPAAGAGGDAAYDEIGAEVVAIAPALPAGMARPHLPAVRIEEPTSQRAWPLRRAPPAAALPVGGEAILHRLPERLVHDRRVLAGMDLLVMPDAADEERVGEQGIELAAGEGGAAAAASVAMPALRRAEAGSIELGLQPVHRAEREIAREDPLHQGGLLRHRLQAARLGAIADRHHATHPHALRLGGGDLVADPLGGDLVNCCV